MERARWILLGAAMVLVAVAFSWSCGGGGGSPTACPTYPGGVPITACAAASPAGPFLQAISICPGPPPPPTPVSSSTSTATAAPTVVETPCPGPIVTSVPSAGATAQFHAVGSYSDGSTQDITNGASTTWTTSDSSVVVPNTTPPGSYFANGSGCATINASSGGISGSPPAVVDVEPIPASTMCPSPAPTTGTLFGR